MEPITTFPFSDLPVELVLIILRYYVQPTFDQTAPYYSKSPYSNARALCHFSRAVRRAVLPELLHTILLGDCQKVRVFVLALHMQKIYAEKANHLHFDYIPHVHKIWIGPDGGHLIPNYLDDWVYASELKLAISLLAPVLLAAPKLAIAFTSLDLLSQCLAHAWKSHTDTNVNDEHSPPPWNTHTLTLSGDSDSLWRLTTTPQGSAFLASISHLTTGSHTLTFDDHFFEAMHNGVSRDYHLPLRIKCIPWESLKTLQTFSVVYPHISPSFNIRMFVKFRTEGKDFHVGLLTLPASLLKKHCHNPTLTPWKIRAFAETGPGEERIRSKKIRFKVSLSPIHFWYNSEDWEKVWACELWD
ncbi:hypothetical protein DEU56DRAFT_983045 [Suillus clintonianus]|uniref:uncharacterized protein n=1 Tax=Suillus clintonianus TaxID=1904413 RepID=UPI001B8732E1|nr:uncharacterized protein DEU56DRAFT_983045 [Suillus clintonianus]KAG2126066.1 hypothetical protein DEU56DRAFT_983045 [Suillus clintonianus]